MRENLRKTNDGGYGFRRSPERRNWKIGAFAETTNNIASFFILRRDKKIADCMMAEQPLENRTMSSQNVPSDAELRPNRAEDAQALEEDTRLRNDIRLLGRILGDTVRDQEGADVFDLVERIRQTSIRFHRDEDKLARR